MQPISTANPRLLDTAAILVSLAVVLCILILAKSFLIPLAWGLVIALASFRMLNKVERKYRIKRLISSLVFVVLILVGLGILVYFFSFEVATMIKDVPSFSKNLLEYIQNILAKLEANGIPSPVIDHLAINNWISEHTEIFSKALTSVGRTIGSITLTGVYLFFILYYRDNYLYFLKLREKNEKDFIRSKEKAKTIASVVSGFIRGLFFVTLISSILLYVIFFLIGLKFALFFALLVALLGLVPYIGNPLGMTLVFIYAAISGDGWLPVLSLAGIMVTSALRSYIFKPVIIGNKIDLNAFVIFLSVIVGGMIWGVSGMVLFIPFAGIVKILLEYNESTRPLVALFETLPKRVLGAGGSDKDGDGR